MEKFLMSRINLQIVYQYLILPQVTNFIYYYNVYIMFINTLCSDDELNFGKSPIQVSAKPSKIENLTISKKPVNGWSPFKDFSELIVW